MSPLQGTLAIASTDWGMRIADHRRVGTHHLLVKLPNHQHLQGLHAHGEEAYNSEFTS